MSIFLKDYQDYESLSKNIKVPELSQSQEVLLLDWFEKCSDGPGHLPTRREFRPEHYAKHMPFVVIFDILEEPLDFKYRFFGTMVRQHSHDNFTGKLLSELPGKGPDSQIWNMLDQTRIKKNAMFKEVPYVGPDADFKRSTVLFLPMADDHNTPDKIFLIANFTKTDFD